MSSNMFDALADEPVMVAKPAAAPAAAPSKPAGKSVVGGVKKADAPKSSNPLPVSQRPLPAEIRKEGEKSRRKQHAPRTDANGKIRGREFDRHSGTGRPASGDNKRSGAGRGNWGALKDAKEDEELAAAAAAAPEAAEGTTDAPAEATEAAEPKVEAEPEPATQSLASYKAEKAKKDKEFEASLGLEPAAPVRQIKPDWYKPEEKSAAPAAPKASSSAAKDVKQQKNFVPLSQVFGEKKEFRGEDRRGPRREGGDRPFKPREGGNRQGGRGGNRGPKRPTFDATSTADLPALGQ